MSMFVRAAIYIYIYIYIYVYDWQVIRVPVLEETLHVYFPLFVGDLDITVLQDLLANPWGEWALVPGLACWWLPSGKSKLKIVMY